MRLDGVEIKLSLAGKEVPAALDALEIDPASDLEWGSSRT
jgi:hypothetical protein